MEDVVVLPAQGKGQFEPGEGGKAPLGGPVRVQAGQLLQEIGRRALGMGEEMVFVEGRRAQQGSEKFGIGHPPSQHRAGLEEGVEAAPDPLSHSRLKPLKQGVVNAAGFWNRT